MTEQNNDNNQHSDQREAEFGPPVTPAPTDGPPEPPEPTPWWKWYDLVYGILFQPVATYQRVAVRPPLAMTVALVAVLNILLAAMGMNTMEHNFLAEHLTGNDHIFSLFQQASSYIALLTFLINMLWWLLLSALLHLVAEFLGGAGRGIATFTVYGLAGLPAVLMLPLQSLEIIFPGNSFLTTISTLGALVVTLWGIALLVIGVREVHQFSTGRAVLVLVTPWLLLLVLLVTLVTLFITAFSSALPILQQLGKL